MSGRWLLLTLTTVLACGCFHSLGTGPDLGLCLLPERRPAQASPPEGGKSAGAESCRPEPPAPPGASIPDSTPPPNRLASRATAEKGNIVRVQAEQPLDRDQLVRKLEVPPELPGSAARVQTLPPLDQKQQRDEAISRAFPPLPASGADTPPLPGPDGHPLTLADLQKLGLAHSPQIRQAVADLEAARGAAIQAGLHPNPNFGYEGDTMGTAALPGYQGGYLEQTVKTAGKLTYARAAALADVRNAELALRAARIDLATRVRTGYFGVVVARESVKVNRALVRFADEIYSVRLEHLRAGQIAPYELSQFRVYAMQARNDLIQALNRSTAAWKQLAAAVGLPGMPPTALAGSVDMPLPRFDYAAVLARIMAQHTDVLTAENTIQRAKFNLLLAKVTPIPDIDLRILLQKDYTSNTFLLTPSVAVGGRVPIFDQNQGNIQQAGAQLARAQEDVQRARNDLTARLAEAFERYETNREIMEYYRDHILPDLVRVYRGSALRYHTEPEKLTFLDVAQPQQNLDDAVGRYLATLQALWTAVVDVAALLQTEDLFGLVQDDGLEPVADVAGLVEVPGPGSCPPAAPLHLLKPDPIWPSAVPPAPPATAPPHEQPEPLPPPMKLPSPEETRTPPPRLRLEFGNDP